MSDRTEKQLSRSERPVVSPQPTRETLFAWIEDKFTGREHMPRYFELKIASGPGGMQYRAETVFQKEFKPNIKKPEREEMVEIANKITAIAQENCNEQGRPQGYSVLAINHIKSAHPYGVYYMKLRPSMFASQEAAFGASDGESDTLSDIVHRDQLLKQSLEHQKANDEHARFMQDGLQRSTGSILALQQEIIRELRTENAVHKTMQLEYFKAMQEAYSTAEDRKMKSDTHRVKMELLERGAGLVLQMVPVVAKTLERNKNGTRAPALAAGEAQEPSPESIAIEQFVRPLSTEQKTALFGAVDETGAHTPGIFTPVQVKILSDVAELKAPRGVLELLLPDGGHAITLEQITAAQAHVSIDQLMPLYAMIKEGQNQKES